MSALDLQDILLAELKKWFDGQLFQKPQARTDTEAQYVPLNLYKQALPILDSAARGEDDDDTDAFYLAPYISVQLQSGKHDDEEGPQDTTVLFNICIFDNDKQNHGHIEVCNIIETIRQNLFKNRTHGGKYYVTLPFSWQLNDEDVWPYFVGSIETHWMLPIIVPEDPYC